MRLLRPILGVDRAVAGAERVERGTGFTPGETVKAQWATLGHFDFINIVEAPDETTMARVSLELGSRGTSHYETLTAIPIDDFIASL